jgi:hypothetical protein
MFLAEYGIDPLQLSCERKYLLFEKIMKHFEEQIITALHPKAGKLIFLKTLSPERALSMTYFDPIISLDYKVLK